MAGGFWQASVPTLNSVRQAPRSSAASPKKSVSAPSTPADVLAREAAESTMKKLAAFSFHDKNLEAILKREQEALFRPDGGNFSRGDLPTFDPNAPRGSGGGGGVGSPGGGGTPAKTRLEEYDEQKALSGGDSSGLLTIRSDPELLVQRIIELEAERDRYMNEAAHYQELLALTQEAAGSNQQQFASSDYLRLKLAERRQAEAEALARSVGTSGGSSRWAGQGGRGISPLTRQMGFNGQLNSRFQHPAGRFSPNTGAAQAGYFGANNAFNQ